MSVQATLTKKEKIINSIYKKLNDLKKSDELENMIGEINEIKKILDDFKLELLKEYAETIESETIDDELHEELDKLSEELLKNPQKGLSGKEVIKEILS